MRIGRTLPPAAAPIGFREIAAGMRAHFEGARAVDRLQAGIAAEESLQLPERDTRVSEKNDAKLQELVDYGRQLRTGADHDMEGPRR